MGTWMSSAEFDGDADRLMGVLTAVDAIERWSPVPFRLADDAERLTAGERVVVEGALLGRGVRFDVDVTKADAAGLSLRATGPFEMAVDYVIEPASSRVSASVLTAGRGPMARLLAAAANAMLAAGALEVVLGRIVDEASAARPCVAA